MPAFIHNRAEHILAKNPSMPKSEAFAIATQQSHALGKSPKGYGTAEGRREAKAKYTTPGDDKKTANPGNLESPKMASAFLNELIDITKSAAFDRKKALSALVQEAGPALGAIGGAGLAAGMGKSPLSGAALGYGVGSLPEIALGKGHG